jgi:hypothetical protein
MRASRCAGYGVAGPMSYWGSNQLRAHSPGGYLGRNNSARLFQGMLLEKARNGVYKCKGFPPNLTVWLSVIQI